MADIITITLVPQFVVNITHEMGNGAGFSVLAKTDNFVIKASIGNSENISGAEIKTLYQAEPSAFTNTQFTKLAGIDDSATADQTDAEIRTAVEAASDSNVFTDADHTKLDSIDTGATDDLTGAEIKVLYEAEAQTNAFDDAEQTKLAGIEASATADQTDAEIRTAVANATDSNVFQDADASKIDGIEGGATQDQTNAEIRTAVEAATNSNVFTDNDHTKLDGIEVSATADQTGAEIKSAYEGEANTNAFNDAAVTKLGLLDEAHYAAPLATLVALTALLEANLADKERRFVEAEIADYFYDAQAGAGDAAPDDQTGGTGWWLKIVASGESAATIKTKYESNADTNEFDDAEQTKLAGIETAATVDQTDAEIRAAVAAATDSNVYTDSEKAELAAIEASATADQSDAEIETAYNNQVAKVSGGEITAGSEVAVRRYSPLDVKTFVTTHSSGSQGWTINDQTGTTYTLVVADIQKLVRLTNAASIALTVPTNAAQAIAIGSQIRIAEFGVGTVTIDGAGVTLNTADDLILGTQHEGALLIKVGTDEWDIIKDLGVTMSDAAIKTAYENNADTNEFSDAEQTKLGAIEASATIDQTDAEIRAAVEAASDSNVFTDADHSKLDDFDMFYDLGMDFAGKPTNAQVIAHWIVIRGIVMPADFSGAAGKIETNPTGALAIDIKDDGTTIGTVSIATNGAFTFTTVSGTAKTVSAGSVVTAIGPGTADATGADISFSLPGIA